MNRFSNTAIVINVAFLLVFLLSILFAWFGYPLFTYDSYCFLPASFELSNGHGLFNKFYNAGFIPDYRFIFYPPLYPVVVSNLMIQPGPLFLYMAVTILNLISVLLSVIILKRMIKQGTLKGKGNVRILAFCVLWIFANCSFILTTNSRPEVLCRLFLYALILLAFTSIRYREMIAGLICTLGLLTSPVFGIYLFFVCILHLVYTGQMKMVIYLAMGAGAGGLLFMLLYPFSISELLDAMSVHSKRVIFSRGNERSVSGFLHYHVFSNNAAMGIFLVVFALVYTVRLALENRSMGNRRLLFITVLFIFVSLICYFAFRNMPMSYYVYVLTPLMLTLVLADINKPVPLLKPALSLLLVSMLSISFFKLSFSFLFNIRNARYTLAYVDKAMQKYRDMPGKKIGLSSSMWIYFADEKKCLPFMLENPSATDADFLILQQYGSGNSMPPPIDGYEIIEDYFDKQGFAIAGANISKYKPFYQYAVYRKKS